jgi:sigma-B regulation protein RsbQ
LTASLRQYGPLVATVMFRAALTSDLRALAPRVAVPCLLLQATADPAVPLAAAQWLATALPQGQLVQVAAQGHFPHVVAPDEVIAAIETFALEAR